MARAPARFLRLRQVCLVAADLEREAARLREALGVEECHRDPNVARYGLRNVLFPVGSGFLEIVSPTRAGTAAGRFLERHGGRHGYMVILDCDDPERYRKRAEALGMRVANVIRHDAYLGVQLHPKDTGAAMIEFNRTEGGADPMGPYAPAGPDWQRAVRRDVVRRLAAVEIESPDPGALAARWAGLLDRAVKGRRIELDSGAIAFSIGDESALAGVELEASRAATHELCGVRFRLAI
ncbi:MAG TPA: VOC family protein [Burkholderiales bacterium]|nr:VOC family protein [Burkholderiales bacterium]